MKFKRYEILSPFQIGTEGFMEQDSDGLPKTFYWKKGTSDAPHYKSYTYIMIEGELETFCEVGSTPEEAMIGSESQAEYWFYWPGECGSFIEEEDEQEV